MEQNRQTPPPFPEGMQQPNQPYMGQQPPMQPPMKPKKKFKGLIIAGVIIVLWCIGAAVKKCNGGNETTTNDSIAESKDTTVLVVDSAKVAALKPNFYIDEDEFTQKTWVMHKNTPKYRNINAMYVYFGMEDGKPTNPRLVFQYEGDDWLFIHNYILLADGEKVEFNVGRSEHDNNSRVWEWNDISLNSKGFIGLKAAMESKDVKLRSEGSKYHKDRTITDKEKQSIIETIDYYFALMGEPTKTAKSSDK